jgi:hypothetical protein
MLGASILTAYSLGASILTAYSTQLLRPGVAAGFLQRGAIEW